MNQIEYDGNGSVKKIINIIKKEKAQNIFFVISKSVKKHSNIQKLEKQIKEKGINIKSWQNFRLNPNILDIEKGIREYKKSEANLVIALGGGSVIDTAKAIVFLGEQSKTPRKYIRENNKLTKKPSVSFVAVPTTTGTGSEATQFFVVYIKNKKYSVDHRYVLPKYVILDPELTYNLNPRVTSTSGLDALCQAIESYWSVKSNKKSRSYSIQAIKTIKNHIGKKDKKSRKSMLTAANQAGKAINITRTTAPHALSYPLTSFFNIPHGLAVALTIGSFFKFNTEIKPKNRKIYNLSKMLGCRNIDDVQIYFNSLIKKQGFSIRLRDYGIKKGDISKIISYISPERLKNNPRIVKREELRKILEKIL